MIRLRAVFYAEEDAAAVMARLVHDGFEATMTRERFAGEDDDEDHPWAVLTDAPEFVLDMLVEKHEGW
ncbi:MAG: (deoxy)nucleoside triphosphate pyrophosphohydrolase, partial [Nocardioidaceae bacterium]